MPVFDFAVVVFAIFGFVHFVTYCVVDCLDFIKAIIKKQNKNREGE